MILGSDELTDADIRIFSKISRNRVRKWLLFRDYTLRRLGSCYKTQLYGSGTFRKQPGKQHKKNT